MSHSVLQDIGLGMLANQIPDPGASGTVRVGDAGISVLKLTVASNARVLADASTPGQVLVIVNRSGSTITTITDSATALNLSIDASEAAICVYTGNATYPWMAVLLDTGAIT